MQERGRAGERAAAGQGDTGAGAAPRPTLLQRLSSLGSVGSAYALRTLQSLGLHAATAPAAKKPRMADVRDPNAMSLSAEPSLGARDDSMSGGRRGSLTADDSMSGTRAPSLAAGGQAMSLEPDTFQRPRDVTMDSEGMNSLAAGVGALNLGNSGDTSMGLGSAARAPSLTRGGQAMSLIPEDSVAARDDISMNLGDGAAQPQLRRHSSAGFETESPHAPKKARLRGASLDASMGDGSQVKALAEYASALGKRGRDGNAR